MHLDQKPSCGLTKLWTCIDLDGSEIEPSAGADGYLYEKRGASGWFRVKRISQSKSEGVMMAKSKNDVSVADALQVMLEVARDRSEERRVGKGCRARWSPWQ